MADSERQAVLAVLRGQEDANARGDAAAVLAPIAEDGVAYELPPPLEYRGKGDVKGIEGWFATWDGSVTVELENPTVLIDGDLAVVFGLSRMRGIKKDSGPVDSWNRRTVVLKRSDNGWKIVHDHNSYPMKMDGSGLAATDLTPK